MKVEQPCSTIRIFQIFYFGNRALSDLTSLLRLRGRGGVRGVLQFRSEEGGSDQQLAEGCGGEKGERGEGKHHMWRLVGQSALSR